jgi:MFS family permease
MTSPSTAPADALPPRLPGIVWATGWVSLLTDLSTEMVYGILPAFYAATLHINVVFMGLIEGLAETIVSLAKLFSGHWSDRTGGRKWWMLVGYSLSTISKPLMVLAATPAMALALRGADRFGKGIRGAPRDALFSREVPDELRGRAFGVQRSMDHGGALLGALVASLLLAMNWATLNELFYWCTIPGAAAVLVILLFVRERAPSAHSPSTKQPFSLVNAWRHTNSTFKRYLLVVAVFSLANSTDMLLLYLALERMREAGMNEPHALATMPLLWAWLHVIKSISAPWGGRLSDRVGRKAPVACGWLLYAVVYAGFALTPSTVAGVVVLWLLFGLYGVYYGLVEGPTLALIADLCPDATRRGGAYGLFHFVTGITALPASLMCGALWLYINPATAFLLCAALALVSAASLPWALRRSVNSLNPPTS